MNTGHRGGEKIRQAIKILIPTFLLIFVLFSGFSTVSATIGNSTIYVNATGGDDSNSGTSWEHAKKTILYGIATVNNGGTVNLANGIYSGENDTNITIDKNMTITGQSQAGTIINGSNSNWGFFLFDNVTALIKNLTITNCFGPIGTAIYNEGTLTVKDSTFSYNVADVGGAMANDGTLDINGCTFNDNSAGLGGAIDSCGALNIKNSNFNKNHADGGGAISSSCEMNINGCTFNDNSADSGGAIESCGPLNIKNSNFYNNRADNGGAIVVYSACTIENSNFNENTADQYGGAIAVCGEIPKTKSDFEIYGAAGSESIEADLVVNGCNFTGNGADEGGAIFNYGTINLNNCIFTNNSALYGTIAGMGDLTAVGCIFENNCASNAGGFLSWDENGNVNVRYCRIVGNTAEEYSNVYLETFQTRDLFLLQQTPEGSFELRYNWWGNNSGPAAGSIYEGIYYDPWLNLTIKANPSTVKAGSTSKITADVYTDSAGGNHSADASQFFSGSQVTFTTNLGEVGSKSITVPWSLGMATATLRADEGPGIATLRATADGQTVEITVNIIPAANAASSTTRAINMQETGLPVNYLIIALLMVMGSLIIPKRK